jgi:uncharacterized repeat protein (TIGR03803 family)
MKKIVAVAGLSFVICSTLSLNAQIPLLWGMTSQGGTSNTGTVFKINGDGNGFQTLHSCSPAIGESPGGSLLFANNHKFYGLTSVGGANNKGTVFSLDTNNVYTDLHDFTGIAGSAPLASLIQADNGKLYGMTFYDDSIQAGTVFSFNPVTNAFAKLATFNGTGNGQSPRGSLMQASNGTIYGMAQGGGANQLGTLFSFDTVTNVITNLHSFDLNTGFNPFGNLMEAANGLLYGMTIYFGTSGPGTIFSFNPATNVYTDLVHFNLTNGSNPQGSLIEATNGKLYGLTFSGGSAAKGMLFCYDITANSITDLVTFTGANGGWPKGSLLQASDGKLYGMTSIGGANNSGIVFSYDLITNLFSDLHDFNGTDGAAPVASLIEALHPVSTAVVETQPEKETVEVYPNPVGDYFNLKYPVFYFKATFRITDVTGRIIYVLNISDRNSIYPINTNFLQNGIYYWELSHDNSVIGNGKIVTVK